MFVPLSTVHLDVEIKSVKRSGDTELIRSGHYTFSTMLVNARVKSRGHVLQLNGFKSRIEKAHAVAL